MRKIFIFAVISVTKKIMQYPLEDKTRTRYFGTGPHSKKYDPGETEISVKVGYPVG